MDRIKEFNTETKPIKPINLEIFIEWSFFLIFTAFLIFMNQHNNLFFHTSIELFINFIFILVFVFAFNTYNINRNNYILILGIGYFCVGIIGIFHLFTYPGMPFINASDSMPITTELWIAARYLEVFTCLISILFIFKPNNIINTYTIYFGYFCITIFLLAAIFIFNIFPDSYVKNVGLTRFKVVSEYVISSMFIITAVIYFKLRKKINNYLFFSLECYFMLSGLAELFFTSFVNVSEWTIAIGHIIKVLACYFIYKGVVGTGLKRPFNLVNNYLNIADNRAKMFEEIVFSNEQCINMIINNSDNAILIISNNKFIFANNKTAGLLGVETSEDIIGLDVDTILINEYRSDAYERIDNTISNKGSSDFAENKLQRFDGQVIDVEVANCYCMYNGKNSAMVMFRDITPKKQILRLENDILENKRIIDKTIELNRMMTEFFANISHELKTPLNVILGAIQILSLQTKDDSNTSVKLETSKYLKTIKQNCYRLVRLVNNLIDISKFDSGYYKVDLHTHNVVSVVEDITLSVADYANNKGIELLFDTDIEEKEMAIDLDKIERIILNLLSNAIKFTDEGGQILVSLWDKDDKILISIKDNGIGMPQDKLDTIFERFGQVEKTLVRNKEGSGIGLSLVKSIVDMHEGTIQVFSELGKGSEFIIELPVRIIEEQSAHNSLLPVKKGLLYESKVEKISIEFADVYS